MSSFSSLSRNRPVSLQDAVVFACRSVEELSRRLSTIEQTLEQVNGDQGGEAEFAEVKDLGVSNKNKIENLLNRLTNVEKNNIKDEVAETLKGLGELRSEFEELQAAVKNNNQIMLDVKEE